MEEQSLNVHEPVQQEPQQSAHRTHWKVLLLILGVAVAVFLGLAFLFRGNFSLVIFEKLQSVANSSQKTFSGQLLFTLSPKNGAGIAPFAYDFRSAALKRFGDERMPGKGSVHTVHHSVSRDGRWGAFVAISDQEFEDAGQNTAVAQVYRAAITGTEDLETEFDEAEPVTYVISALKSFPSISSAGEIVYMSRGAGVIQKDFAPLNDAESWVIYHVDNLGVEELVDFGISPKWVDSARFVYWKNDGMYLYSISNSQSEKVWGSHGAVFNNMKMDISDDSRFVAWSSPENGRIFIFEALDWGPPSLQLKHIIDTHGFWATFSPDSAYLAVQEVDWENLMTDPRPRITFYDMETFEKMPLEIDLDAYDQEVMFMTDWVL